jgi:hypothetical protein
MTEQVRALLRAVEEADQRSQSDASSYKRMLEDAVLSLAAIDAALGIDPDEAGGAEPILEAITTLKKQAAVAAAALPYELKGIPEAIREGSGFWRTCTGCYESEDGHPVGHYPHSKILGCALGGGCSECGGIGAVWDTTDYAAMADEGWAQMQREQAEKGRAERVAAGWLPITAPGQVAVGDKLKFTIGETEYRETVKQILDPGTDKEELIYNKRRNYYLITSMAIANKGSQKNVRVLAIAKPARQEEK